MLGGAMWLFPLATITFLGLSAEATSAGLKLPCSLVGSNWGCSKYEMKADGKPNRKKCIAADKGEMAWADATDRTAGRYTVRTGDKELANDLKVYVPGEQLSVYIKVIDYKFKYRGLMIHAIDAANKTVGEWNIPKNDFQLMQKPCTNAGVAIHNSGEVKPLSLRLKWTGPPTGTGKVTFLALFKSGGANIGAFHWPDVDLSLDEGNAPASNDQQYFRATTGQTCQQTCAAANLYCDAPDLISTKQDFEAGLERFVACDFPLLSECAKSSAPALEGGFCSYYDSTCAATELKPSCDDTSAGGDQLCRCSDTMSVVSSSWRAAPISSLLLGAAVVSGGGNVRTLLLMLVGLGGVEGHNWLRIQARSGHMAATFRPCKPRLSDTSIHVQVGPGQPFGLSWAVGHGGLNRFVLLSGDDEHLLKKANLDAMIDDYISQGTSTHMEPANRRIHSTPNPNGKPDGGKKGYLQKQNISIHHVGGPYGPDSDQYKFSYHYQDRRLSTDKYVTYKSAKYPFVWAGAYKIVESGASDGDSVNVTIPVDTPPGHYVLHYRWSGYFDCVDIDVQPKEVKWIYGDPTKDVIIKYTKVDHCTFTQPMGLVSNLRFVKGNAQACLDDTPIESVSGRLGFQVSPVVLPPIVPAAFRDEPVIPWGNNKEGNWTCHRGSGAGTPFKIREQWDRGSCQTACEQDPRCVSYDHRTHTDKQICLGGTALERYDDTTPRKSDLCRLSQGNSFCPLGCFLPGVETRSVYCEMVGQKSQVCRVPIDEGCRLFEAGERPNLGYEGPLGRRYCSKFGISPEDPVKAKKDVAEDTFACWAVEPRASFTLPTPGESYDTVDDPEDPMYYSTCFVREVITPFLPQLTIKPAPKVPWFSNGHCVDCQAYADTQREKTDGFIPAPIWDMVDKCVNCDKYPATASAPPVY